MITLQRRSLIYMFLFTFTISIGGCAKFSFSKREAVKERGNELIQMIKAENYGGIYRNAATCVQSNYSEDQFVTEMRDAVNKLREVDGELKFSANDSGSEKINDEYTITQLYGVGVEEIEVNLGSKLEKALLPKGDKHALILTSWQPDEEVRLTAFQVLLSDGEKNSWFGTSSCKTTERTTVLEGGVSKIKTTIVTNPLGQ